MISDYIEMASGVDGDMERYPAEIFIEPEPDGTPLIEKTGVFRCFFTDDAGSVIQDVRRDANSHCECIGTITMKNGKNGLEQTLTRYLKNR